MSLSLLERLAIQGASPLTVVATQTTHATPGTRSTHAHGLTDNRGNAVTPTIIIPVATGADADGAITPGDIVVVKADDTNVTVRCSVASQTFTLLVG